LRESVRSSDVVSALRVLDAAVGVDTHGGVLELQGPSEVLDIA
jgi:hypothetical protein